MTELVEIATVLGIKIDKFTTKLYLFDVVDGKFHLLVTSEANTTNKPPFKDLREGFYSAIDHLQQITGRSFIDEEMNLIVPSQSDGSGVDLITVTFGFLNHTSIITAGLLDDVSISTLSKIAQHTHLKHADQISLSDSRKIEEILSSVANIRPDLLLMAGGTESGANKSVMRMLDIILFCFKHLPKERFPEFIFAGNSSISKKIEEIVAKNGKISLVENIRPTLEEENLNPTIEMINELNAQILIKKLPGFEYLYGHTRSVPMPFIQTISNMTKFLSKLSPEKNTQILVIDQNKEMISIIGGNHNDLFLDVQENNLYCRPDIFVSEINPKDIQQWTPIKKDLRFFENYIWGKSIRPDIIPLDFNDFLTEHSVVKNQIKHFYHGFKNRSGCSNDFWNQIVINGDILSNFENPSDIALILLDAIQPKGISNLFLDLHGVLPVLGAIAADSPILPIQILEGASISLLAKVFSIQSRAKPGTPILKARFEYKDGTFTEEQIIKGSISKFPITTGQVVKIFLEPLINLDMSQFGKNLDKGIITQGGLCGVIFDARSRPVQLNKDHEDRIEQIRSWYKAMGINMA